MEKEIKAQFKYLDYARIVFVSAKTSQKVQNIFPLIKEAFENSQKRVQTSVFKRCINRCSSDESHNNF